MLSGGSRADKWRWTDGQIGRSSKNVARWEIADKWRQTDGQIGSSSSQVCERVSKK